MHHESHEKNLHSIERWGSLALGTGLAAWALKRRSVGSLPAGLAAAALLFRGSTGTCPLYGALGLSTAEGDGDGRAEAWSGRDEESRRRQEESWRTDHDLVTEASEESFPASDPPSFTPGTAT